MNWFVLLGISVLALGSVGLWINSKKSHNGRSVGLSDIAIFVVCSVLAVAGFLQMVIAGLEGQQQPEGVAGVVTNVTVDPNHITTLTVQVGESRADTYNIDCLPEQKACQAAHVGDLVQYDRTTHPSGWVTHREIRFITKGANSP